MQASKISGQSHGLERLSDDRSTSDWRRCDLKGGPGANRRPPRQPGSISLFYLEIVSPQAPSPAGRKARAQTVWARSLVGSLWPHPPPSRSVPSGWTVSRGMPFLALLASCEMTQCERGNSATAKKSFEDSIR
jgi:hypothetical protein